MTSSRQGKVGEVVRICIRLLHTYDYRFAPSTSAAQRSAGLTNQAGYQKRTDKRKNINTDDGKVGRTG